MQMPYDKRMGTRNTSRWSTAWNVDEKQRTLHLVGLLPPSHLFTLLPPPLSLTLLLDWGPLAWPATAIFTATATVAVNAAPPMTIAAVAAVFFFVAIATVPTIVKQNLTKCAMQHVVCQADGQAQNTPNLDKSRTARQDEEDFYCFSLVHRFSFSGTIPDT